MRRFYRDAVAIRALAVDLSRPAAGELMAMVDR
jgi:hypothetical protein